MIEALRIHLKALDDPSKKPKNFVDPFAEENAPPDIEGLEWHFEAYVSMRDDLPESVPVGMGGTIVLYHVTESHVFEYCDRHGITSPHDRSDLLYFVRVLDKLEVSMKKQNLLDAAKKPEKPDRLLAEVPETWSKNM